MNETHNDLTNQCVEKNGNRSRPLTRRTRCKLPKLVKFLACLITCLLSTTVAGQDYFRLDDSLGRNGAKQFRLDKIKGSHKLPADFSSVSCSPEQALVLLVRNRDRAELSRQQIKAIKDINRTFFYSQIKDQRNFNRIQNNEKYSAIEKEEMLLDLESKMLRHQEELSLVINDLLLPHQKSISKQLQFDQAVQSYGVARVLTCPPFSDDLKTKKKQADAIMKIKKESEDELVEAFLEFEKKVQQIKKRSVGKMINELSGTQRKRLKEFNDNITENLSKLKM